MELSLRGRVCVVTGGSSGIGLACAQILVAEGADVLLVGRDRDRLAEAIGRCGQGPGRVASLSIDVTSPDAGAAVLRRAEDELGPIQVLINSAGTSGVRALEEITDAEWDEQWELNVMAPKRLMDAVAPAMMAAGAGAIVNVCSSAGRRPSARDAAYSVSKRAELALTQVYAQRLRPSGVRVNAVAPGPTETSLWLEPGGLLDRGSGEGEDREEALRRIGEGLPLGRLASAEEVAAVIVFLISSGGSPDGSPWSVDGGHVPDVHV